MPDLMNKSHKKSEESLDRGYTGTRADALDSGVVINIGEMAQEAGFLWPVDVTKEVWDDCVAWSKNDSVKQVRTNERTRLWTIVNECAHLVRSTSPPGSSMFFRIRRVPCDGKSTQARAVILQAIAHVGDSKEAILTIRKPPKENSSR